MKAKISKYGSLYLERGNEYKQQNCPFITRIDYEPNCGDWCPLFNTEIKDTIYIQISLCHKEYIVSRTSEFIDERNIIK